MAMITASLNLDEVRLAIDLEKGNAELQSSALVTEAMSIATTAQEALTQEMLKSTQHALENTALQAELHNQKMFAAAQDAQKTTIINTQAQTIASLQAQVQTAKTAEQAALTALAAGQAALATERAKAAMFEAQWHTVSACLVGMRN